MAGAFFSLILRMALRSLLGHRIKVLIVGSLLAFGTFLLVLGTTLLGSIERSMEASITGSITGHIQVLAEDAKDPLAFFGPGAFSEQDLGVVPSFPQVREALATIPEIKAIVPMGRHIAQAILGNEVDETLEELRLAVRNGDEARSRRLIGKFRRMALLMREDVAQRVALTDSDEEREGLANLERAASDELWAEFEEDPEGVLDFLEMRIPQLADDEMPIYIPFIGTDLDAFAEHFEHFQIVEGEAVPPGQRGFLANKTFFEDFSKNRIARMLDKLKEAREFDGKRFADDAALQDQIKRMGRLTRYVTHQLDPQDAGALETELRARFPGVEGDLDDLVAALLEVDDANFDERYALFYELVAPRIRLYRVKVGDTFTIRSYTKAGYPKAINLKIWGTFQFKGLERSALASAYSLMDLMSFRDLFGLMTVERREELEAIRDEVGLEAIAADDAEDALFGAAIEVEELEAEAFDLSDRLEALLGASEGPPDDGTFDPETLDQGTIVHAAVLLHDRDELGTALAKIRRIADERKLGVEAVPWIAVTGIVGQLILVMRAVLYMIIFVVFLVALVIINNSMVMATMDRTSEIGTMRAIGASKRFILTLFLLETLVLGAIASGAGALAASAILLLLGKAGIPASGDFLIFLFGGPALYPRLGPGQIVAALLAIVLVSLISTLYPARLAARIAPVVAMQRKE